MECQEIGCRHHTTKEWAGKKVCDDHYDYYREKYEELLRRQAE